MGEIISPEYNPKNSPNMTGLTNVNISVTVNSLLAVTESTSSFQLDLTLKLKWFDNRINLSPRITSQLLDKNNTIDNIILGSNYISNFWIPDIYFQNALSVSIVNSGLSIKYLTIGLNNNITYTVRMNAAFICKMNLRSFPQDYQYCSIEAVSLTQTSSQMSIYWEEFIAVQRDYPTFRIRSTTTGNCSRSSYLGDFSCDKVTIKLVRQLNYYMIRYYAPTFLSVIISFVGFWIPPCGFPARVAIIIGPLLNLITQDIAINNSINVSYVVAMHWWMIWCQIFVFFTLIEYATALSWAHFVNEKKAMCSTRDQNNNQTLVVKGHYFGNKNWYSKCGRVVDKILCYFFGNVDYFKDPMSRNKIDYCARISFTFMWILYVLLYIFSTICPWAANYNL